MRDVLRAGTSEATFAAPAGQAGREPLPVTHYDYKRPLFHDGAGSGAGH
jgi:hypothetical protein